MKGYYSQNLSIVNGFNNHAIFQGLLIFCLLPFLVGKCYFTVIIEIICSLKIYLPLLNTFILIPKNTFLLVLLVLIFSKRKYKH